MPGQRQRVRRDVNLTAVVCTLIVCATAVTLAYLANVYQLAAQGLDVRDLVRIRLGPEQWGWLAVVAGGISGGGLLVKRSNRTEHLVGRRVPEALDAQRADIVNDLASLFARALLEHREQVAAEQLPAADVEAEDMVERMTQLLEAERDRPPLSRRLSDTGQWEALVHGTGAP